MVAAKIESQAAVLRRYRENHPEALEPSEIDAVGTHAAAAAEATSLDALRGIEGTAAARHFSLLGRTVPPEVGFDGRNRRPPRDPLNALLSFGYVLVGNELQALLDAMGYDPYIGFYHQLDYGRPSLALDLLEEFRAPLVDRFSAKLLNLGALKPEDFTSSPQGGVYLSRVAQKRYFAAWEQELEAPFVLGEAQTTFRQLFRRQAERLARTLQAGEPYQAFRYPC